MKCIQLYNKEQNQTVVIGSRNSRRHLKKLLGGGGGGGGGGQGERNEQMDWQTQTHKERQREVIK